MFDVDLIVDLDQGRFPCRRWILCIEFIEIAADIFFKIFLHRHFAEFEVCKIVTDSRVEGRDCVSWSMAWDAFVFGGHVLAFNTTLDDTGETEAIICSTIGLTQVEIVFDNRDDEFEADLRERLEELHEVDVRSIAERKAVLVVFVQFCSLVLVIMFWQLNVFETLQVIFVLLAEVFSEFLEEAGSFFRVELFDEVKVGVDKEGPEEALDFGLVDVESFVGPGTEADEGLVVSRWTGLLRSNLCIFRNFLVGRLGAESGFGADITFLCKVVDDLIRDS